MWYGVRMMIWWCKRQTVCLNSGVCVFVCSVCVFVSRTYFSAKRHYNIPPPSPSVFTTAARMVMSAHEYVACPYDIINRSVAKCEECVRFVRVIHTLLSRRRRVSKRRHWNMSGRWSTGSAPLRHSRHSTRRDPHRPPHSNLRPYAWLTVSIICTSCFSVVCHTYKPESAGNDFFYQHLTTSHSMVCIGDILQSSWPWTINRHACVTWRNRFHGPAVVHESISFVMFTIFSSFPTIACILMDVESSS